MGSRCSVLGAHLQSCVSTLEYPLPPAFSQVVNLSQDLTAAFSKKRNKMSELLWSHCVSLQITYKMSFPWTGEQGGGSLLQAQLTFRQQLTQKLSLSFSTFLFPSAICSRWLFKQHPVPPRCVPSQVFLLLFVTDVWSYVFSANTLLPSLPDAISLEAVSSHTCVLICACFAMCLCSGGWFLLFQLPDLGKALTGFFTYNLCGKVAAVFPSFSKA